MSVEKKPIIFVTGATGQQRDPTARELRGREWAGGASRVA